MEAPGVTPRLFLQRVIEAKWVKNRVHPYLSCDAVDAEVERLVALGARVVAVREHNLVRVDPQRDEFLPVALSCRGTPRNRGGAAA